MDFYTPARDALYCLCKLNGISLTKEDIVIDFNIGRSDDDRVVAEIIKTLHEAGVFSMGTLRARYFGYNEKQSLEEDLKISQEGQPDNSNNDNNNKVDSQEVNQDELQTINGNA